MISDHSWWTDKLQLLNGNIFYISICIFKRAWKFRNYFPRAISNIEVSQKGAEGDKYFINLDFMHHLLYLVQYSGKRHHSASPVEHFSPDSRSRVKPVVICPPAAILYVHTEGILILKQSHTLLFNIYARLEFKKEIFLSGWETQLVWQRSYTQISQFVYSSFTIFNVRFNKRKINPPTVPCGAILSEIISRCHHNFCWSMKPVWRLSLIRFASCAISRRSELCMRSRIWKIICVAEHSEWKTQLYWKIQEIFYFLWFLTVRYSSVTATLNHYR